MFAAYPLAPAGRVAGGSGVAKRGRGGRGAHATQRIPHPLGFYVNF